MIKRTVFYSLMLCSLVVLCSQLVRAEIPKILSFQGVLKDAAGNPRSGTFRMEFSLFERPTGGTATWGETQSVVVENGFYNVLLGRVTSLAGVPFDRPYWLEVKVDGTTLSPRFELAASPYALGIQAEKQSKWTLRDNSLYPNVLAWNVGIGINNPQTKLHVKGNVLVEGEKNSPVRLTLESVGDVSVPDSVVNLTARLLGGNGWQIMREGATSDFLIRVHRAAPAGYPRAVIRIVENWPLMYDNVIISAKVVIGTRTMIPLRDQKMLNIIHPTGGYDGLGIRLDPNLLGGTIWNIDNDNGELKFIKSIPVPGYPRTIMTLSNPMRVDTEVGINTDPKTTLHVVGDPARLTFPGHAVIFGVATGGSTAFRPYAIRAHCENIGPARTGGGFYAAIDSRGNNVQYLYGANLNLNIAPDSPVEARVLTTVLAGTPTDNDYAIEAFANDPAYIIYTGAVPGTPGRPGRCYFAGKVGIGTPSPDTMLHVSPVGGGTVDAPLLRLDNIVGPAPTGATGSTGSIRIKVGGTIYRLALY